MRIAFVDFAAWNYTVESPLRRAARRIAIGTLLSGARLRPAGARSVSAQRHDAHARLAGVQHLAADRRKREANASRRRPATHWPIAMRWCCRTLPARPAICGPRCMPRGRLMLWTQHAHDQPAMQALGYADVRERFDGIALVSDWQQQCYVRAVFARSGAMPGAAHAPRTGVCRFARRWPPGGRRQDPAAGAGLHQHAVSWTGSTASICFRWCAAACPTSSLKIFSSMQVYHVPAGQGHGRLWPFVSPLLGDSKAWNTSARCPARNWPRRCDVTLLAYPNHFPETSCIAVMEALAAGLRVVTSRLAALPETLGGCGQPDRRGRQLAGLSRAVCRRSGRGCSPKSRTDPTAGRRASRPGNSTYVRSSGTGPSAGRDASGPSWLGRAEWW